MATASSAAHNDAEQIGAVTKWIDFSTTENPFGTPVSFTNALANAIADGLHTFQPDRTALSLRRALAQTCMLPEESFLVGTTVANMIGAVSQAFEPCTVGVMVPCPIEYVLTLANTGHRVERFTASSGYVTPTATAIAEQGHEINAAILANPGYPTSRLLPETILSTYLETCDWVIVDERSIELTLGGKSVAHLVEHYRNLIVIQTFTEQYALPGAPVSYCIAHPDIVSEIRRFYDSSALSLFPEALAEASAQEHPKLDGVRGFLYSEIPWMQTMLSLVPGVEIFPAEANYVMCSYSNESGLNLAVDTVDELAAQLREQGCIVRKLGDTPGLGGDGHFCVSVRTRQENEQLISALRSIVM